MIEQAKFEYFSLAEAFNKGLNREVKRKTFEETEKYWKHNQRLHKNQLKPIQSDINNANAKEIEQLEFLNRLGAGAKARLDKSKKIEKKIDYRELVCVHTNGQVFEIFRRLWDFIRIIDGG